MLKHILWLKRFAVCGILGLVVLGAARGRQIEMTETAAIGRFTAQQAIDQTAPYLQSIASNCGSLKYVVQHTALSGNGIQDWLVTAIDSEDHELAYAVLDAETGKLVFVTRASSFMQTRSNPFSQNEAIRSARSWMTAAGYQSSDCRLISKRLPSAVRGQWTIVLANDLVQTVTVLNRSTGIVESFRVQRPASKSNHMTPPKVKVCCQTSVD